MASMKAMPKEKQSLFNMKDQPVMEQETVDKMKQVLMGKITGDRAAEIRKMFMDEFGAEALTILKKELKIK